jgi:hypothetical protein
VTTCRQIKTNKHTMSKKWNADIMIPTDNYIVRIIGATYAPSKKGNPMLTLTTEIVSPQVVEVAGESISVAGIKCTNYLSALSTEQDGSTNTERTESMRERISKFYKDMELDTTLDFENLNTKVLLGKNVHALIEAEVAVQRKSPTAEQAKKGQPGDILKHPKTGQALVKYWPKIKEFFGIAEGSVSTLF